MIKVIVAGGRDFDDAKMLSEKLYNFAMPYNVSDIEWVTGKARGADTLGEMWAREAGAPVKEFPADWDRYGKAAGYIRNEQMAKYADVLIAFWDGESKGTKHMIDLARKHGLEVHIYTY